MAGGVEMARYVVRVEMELADGRVEWQESEPLDSKDAAELVREHAAWGLRAQMVEAPPAKVKPKRARCPECHKTLPCMCGRNPKG